MQALTRDLGRRLAAAVAVLLGPLAIALTGLPRPVYMAGWIAGGALALGLLLRSPRNTRLPALALSFAALCASVVTADLLLRTSLGRRLFPQPAATQSRRWPTNPELYRYLPDQRFRGTVIGDLAASTGRAGHSPAGGALRARPDSPQRFAYFGPPSAGALQLMFWMSSPPEASYGSRITHVLQWTQLLKLIWMRLPSPSPTSS